MYIDEIKNKEGGIIRLSSVNEESGQQIDFDTTLSKDEAAKAVLERALSGKGVEHYLIVDNVIYDQKQVDFSSKNVKNTLYYIQENGKVYRWENVGISFIRMGGDAVSVATVIVSRFTVRPFNRRSSFRVPVDMDGKLYFNDKNHRCYVHDVSHNGFGVIMSEPKEIPGIGDTCFLSWSEEIFTEDRKSKVSTKYELEGVVARQQARLGKQVIIGCTVENEPDTLRDYIQHAQTSRGIVKEVAEAKSGGVQRAENWEVAKELGID